MDSFEDVAELLDYPMFVVTTASNGKRAGCLVGFTTQISIDPARFLVGLSVNNHTHQVAADASRLVVHLLAELDQHVGDLNLHRASGLASSAQAAGVRQVLVRR